MARMGPGRHAPSWAQPEAASALHKMTWIHATSLGADAILTVSLAGTLFFTVSTHAARPKVLLYLLITMAPFAILAPVVGPVVDRLRRWRRLVVALTCLLRAAMCILMAHDIRSLLLYPEAFAALICSKAYLVAKGAIVPALLSDPSKLVTANARLARTALVAGAAAGLVGVGVYKAAGSQPTLWLAAIAYVVAALIAVRLPRSEAHEGADGSFSSQTIPAPPIAASASHMSAMSRLRQRGTRLPDDHTRIALAASAMGLLRGAVGFLTFLVLFALKEANEPPWFYGAVIAASGLGAFAGAALAPPVRRRINEETLLVSALAISGIGALVVLLALGPRGSPAVAFALGLAASAARVAFDALVQERSPEEARGRAFARFETRFQLTWVIGAFVGVVLHLSLDIGLAAISVTMAVAAFSYLRGLRAGIATAAVRRDPELYGPPVA